MGQASASELAARYEYVRRFLRKLGAASEADDITQQVFTEAAAVGDTDLPLLLTIARRRFIDSQRKARRVQAIRHEQVVSYESQVDLARVVSEGLRQLPPDQREVVVLKIVRGLSFAEISSAVEASEGACKMRLRRGLEKLQSYLEGQGIEQ